MKTKKDGVTIISNYQWREFIGFWELNASQQAEIWNQGFDYLDDIESEYFINYRGRWYHLSDFMSLHNKVHCPNPPDFMVGWDGYHSDSFFSGVLIKVSDCGDAYKIATYIS